MQKEPCKKYESTRCASMYHASFVYCRKSRDSWYLCVGSAACFDCEQPVPHMKGATQLRIIGGLCCRSVIPLALASNQYAIPQKNSESPESQFRRCRRLCNQENCRWQLRKYSGISVQSASVCGAPMKLYIGVHKRIAMMQSITYQAAELSIEPEFESNTSIFDLSSRLASMPSRIANTELPCSFCALLYAKLLCMDGKSGSHESQQIVRGCRDENLAQTACCE